MTEHWMNCGKPGCGFSTEGRTNREAQARMNRHTARTDHIPYRRAQLAHQARAHHAR